MPLSRAPEIQKKVNEEASKGEYRILSKYNLEPKF
jgi:hypothetical protein